MDVRSTDNRRFLRHLLREQDVLKSFLLAATRDSHQADDLFQEVACVLLEKFGAFDESRPFRSWALGFARIEVLRWRRAIPKRIGLLSERTLSLLAQSADHTGEQHESRRAHLDLCLQSLGEHLREIIQLRYVQSLPISALALRVQKSVAAVEMILVRVRRVLRDCVDRKMRQSEGYAS